VVLEQTSPQGKTNSLSTAPSRPADFERKPFLSFYKTHPFCLQVSHLEQGNNTWSGPNMFESLLIAIVSIGSSKLPTWDTIVPDPAKQPSAGLPTPEGISHITVYSADNTTWGAYNHGPTIARSNGTFVLSWYNAGMEEFHAQRALFATSSDGKSWSSPAVLFNTTGALGIETEAWITTPEGRLYGMASSWDVYGTGAHGTAHGPDAALMRRVHINSSNPFSTNLGPVFWLADSVPTGFDTYCNFTYHDAAAVGAVSSADAAYYRSRLVSTTPSNGGGLSKVLGERSMYEALSDHTKEGMQDLVLLYRYDAGNTTLWASTCSVPVGPVQHDATMGVCRPGRHMQHQACPCFSITA
jgi:hypothetical protein